MISNSLPLLNYPFNFQNHKEKKKKKKIPPKLIQ